MKQNPQYQAACQLLPYARTEPAEPRWPQVRALLVSAANSICQGKATPTDALAAADVEAGSLFQ
jgi:maltose-binding protein MalE